MTDRSCSTQTRLEEAMAEWARRAEAGLPADPRAFVADYPDIADELTRAIEFEARLGRACRQMGGPRPVSSLPPGTAFGDYVIVREVGRGGMGVVYETWQASLSRRVALKLLSPALCSSPGERRRFLSEARIVALLDHEHIVDVYEAGEHDGIPYFAMQFIDGESLAQALAREREAPTVDEAAYLRRIAEYGAQAAEALAEAHARGVVHRDAKPSNLLVSDGRLWVTDFGLARARDLTEAQSSHRPAGTVRYMSPEQLAGTAAPFDGRCDVYSLAVTLYEMLTLEHPGVDWAGREPPPLRQKRPAVPVDLETIVLKAMAAEPDDRYTSAGEMTADLRRWLQGEPVKARPLTRWQRLRRVLWRRRRAVTVVGLALALGLFAGLAIGGVGLWQAYRQTDRQRRVTLDTVRELARVVADHMKEEPGKAAEVKAAIEKALRLAELAAEQAPPEHELHEEVAVLTHRLYEAEAGLGNEQRALEHLKLAEQRLRGLIHHFPDRQRVRYELVMLLTRLNLNVDRHAPFDVLDARLGEVEEHLEALLRQEPRKAEYTERKICLLMCKADRLTKADRWREALGEVRRALRLCEHLRERYPKGHPLSYIRLCYVWSRMADCHQYLGEPEAAEQAYRQMLGFDRHLASEYPGRFAIREETLALAFYYASFLSRYGRSKEAVGVLREAVADLTRAVEQHPDKPAFRTHLVQGWYSLGSLAYARGDDGEARRAFGQAVGAFRQGRFGQVYERMCLLQLLAMPFAGLMDLEGWRERIEAAGEASEPEGRLLRGMLALRAGDDTRAEELLKGTEGLGPGNRRVARYALAILHARAGQTAKARELLAEADQLPGPEPGGSERLLRLEARRAVEGR
jgi:tetratricopeptide (TPR) repeat protein